jgi:hypothetical protein
MADIDTALTASRDAVEEMIRAGKQSGAAFTAPRAPGKWSPSQVVEHVQGAGKAGEPGDVKIRLSPCFGRRNEVYGRWAYSILACFRIGWSSASFQSARKSW